MCNKTTLPESSSSPPAVEPTSASSTSGTSRQSSLEDDDNDAKTTTAAPPTSQQKPPNLWRLLDPQEPWILVPQGSLMGYFDLVPAQFRTGPWHVACQSYLVIMCAWIIGNLVDCYQHPPPPLDGVLYYDTDTWQWKGNAAGFLWALYIAYRVVHSPMGYAAWTSYTLQSWTLILLRYGLCTLSPFVPRLAVYQEYLRFPMLLQMTVTFGVWNLVLFPVMLLLMKTPKQRRGFTKFCFQFTVFQLHFVNLPLAVFSGLYGSPLRTLTKLDFCVALALALQYVLLYLLILDRLGAHYYFIFSPRTPWALLSWTAFLGCVYAGFWWWQSIMESFLPRE